MLSIEATAEFRGIVVPDENGAAWIAPVEGVEEVAYAGGAPDVAPLHLWQHELFALDLVYKLLDGDVGFVGGVHRLVTDWAIKFGESWHRDTGAWSRGTRGGDKGGVGSILAVTSPPLARSRFAFLGYCFVSHEASDSVKDNLELSIAVAFKLTQSLQQCSVRENKAVNSNKGSYNFDINISSFVTS